MKNRIRKGKASGGANSSSSTAAASTTGNVNSNAQKSSVLNDARNMATEAIKAYVDTTPKRVQLIDMFAIYCVFTTLVQLCYMVVVGSFPFNSFLAGTLSSVGLLVFTVCFRQQVVSPEVFHGISQQRAYADYVVCGLVLFFVVVTFLG